MDLIFFIFFFFFHNIRVTITIGGIKSEIWQLDVIRNAQKQYRLTSFILLLYMPLKEFSL